MICLLRVSVGEEQESLLTSLNILGTQLQRKGLEHWSLREFQKLLHVAPNFFLGHAISATLTDEVSINEHRFILHPTLGGFWPLEGRLIPNSEAFRFPNGPLLIADDESSLCANLRQRCLSRGHGETVILHAATKQEQHASCASWQRGEGVWRQCKWAWRQRCEWSLFGIFQNALLSYSVSLSR